MDSRTASLSPVALDRDGPVGMAGEADAVWVGLVEAALAGIDLADSDLAGRGDPVWGDGEFQGYDPEYVHATITASLAADPGVGVGGLAGGFEALGDVP
ncbi:hypothetical protein, partial [Phytoactinopolyspora limicola]|uniref:hypothetical protein n=1 Tax=Phytoactinopolyspora limicola TaxID=2715536 RepID=UPI00140B9DC2